MKLLLSYTILLAIAASLLQACTKTDCADAELHFGLVGFSDHEADSIILRRFTKNSGFTSLVDTARLDIGFKRSNDTLGIASQLVNLQMTSGYDFEFYFPVAGRSYRITEINEEQSEQRKSIFNNTKELCINRVTSLKVNGNVLRPDYNLFYLTR